MRVTFVLPKPTGIPVGGYRAHYEMADHLAQMGHKVIIVHPYRSGRRWFWPRFITNFLIRHALGLRVVTWHTFGAPVRVRLVPFLHDRFLPRGDVTVLSSWQTSLELSGRKQNGPMVQWVFDYEVYQTSNSVDKDRIRRSLSRSDVTHFAGSRIVARMLRDFGVDVAATVHCGLDLDKYGPGEPRLRPLVLFPCRSHPSKGAEDVLAAAELLKARSPEVAFCAFGNRDPRHSWIDYVGVASDQELVSLYRSATVFILPSTAEGWGLTALEAMSCGAAVVSTRNGGVEEFLEDQVNALLVPVGDAQAIAEATEALLINLTLRNRITKAAHQTTRGLSWRTSAEEFEAALLPVVARGTVRPG